MARRSHPRVAWSLLTLVAFVLTHQLVFLYTYGAGAAAALVRTGHGVAWSTTVFVVVGAGAFLAVAAILELRRLAARARAFKAIRQIRPRSLDEPLRVLLSETSRGAAWITPAVAAMLLLSENVEHALIGAPLPGLSVLSGSEYSGTVPILIAVALATSLVRALYFWRRDVLVARLHVARAKLPRASAMPVRTALVADRRPATHMCRRSSGRAPPAIALI